MNTLDNDTDENTCEFIASTVLYLLSLYSICCGLQNKWSFFTEEIQSNLRLS